jgi:uncharacterized damage-inducible protein DinB
VTTPDQQAEFERMRSYYLTQGERYTFSEMWPRAVQARLELLGALAGVDDAEAEWAPSADDWSIKEVALHVLNGSRSTRRVVQALSAGESADSSNIDPPRKTTDASMDDLREQLRDDGIDWASVTATLPPTPPSEPTAPHSMFGELPARSWYLFQRTHDLDHRGQIEAVKSADGYPGAVSASGQS